jgi:hypothetical protein
LGGRQLVPTEALGVCIATHHPINPMLLDAQQQSLGTLHGQSVSMPSFVLPIDLFNSKGRSSILDSPLPYTQQEAS